MMFKSMFNRSVHFYYNLVEIVYCSLGILPEDCQDLKKYFVNEHFQQYFKHFLSSMDLFLGKCFVIHSAFILIGTWHTTLFYLAKNLRQN